MSDSGKLLHERVRDDVDASDGSSGDLSGEEADPTPTPTESFEAEEPPENEPTGRSASVATAIRRLELTLADLETLHESITHKRSRSWVYKNVRGLPSKGMTDEYGDLVDPYPLAVQSICRKLFSVVMGFF
jgi:hypothetical protein